MHCPMRPRLLTLYTRVRLSCCNNEVHSFYCSFLSVESAKSMKDWFLCLHFVLGVDGFVLTVEVLFFFHKNLLLLLCCVLVNANTTQRLLLHVTNIFVWGMELYNYMACVPRAGKNLGFLEKVFSFLKVLLVFFRFQCTNKTEHKISTQEEYPIHNSLSFRAFL